MNTNMTGFRCFSKNLCVLELWAKVASALEELISTIARVCIVHNRQSRKIVLLTNFTMGPNEQNQYFVEMRQKVYIQAVVLQRGLPSLDGKLMNVLSQKSGKSGCQTQVR